MTSPLDGLIKTPIMLEPVIEMIYTPAKFIAKLIDKPDGIIKVLFQKFNFNDIDQIMYLMGFFVAIVSGWILNTMQNTTTRKLFSTIMGFIV
jgi:hypothetical protein